MVNHSKRSQTISSLDSVLAGGTMHTILLVAELGRVFMHAISQGLGCLARASFCVRFVSRNANLATLVGTVTIRQALSSPRESNHHRNRNRPGVHACDQWHGDFIRPALKPIYLLR